MEFNNSHLRTKLMNIEMSSMSLTHCSSKSLKMEEEDEDNERCVFVAPNSRVYFGFTHKANHLMTSQSSEWGGTDDLRNEYVEFITEAKKALSKIISQTAYPDALNLNPIYSFNLHYTLYWCCLLSLFLTCIIFTYFMHKEMRSNTELKSELDNQPGYLNLVLLIIILTDIALQIMLLIFGAIAHATLKIKYYTIHYYILMVSLLTIAPCSAISANIFLIFLLRLLCFMHLRLVESIILNWLSYSILSGVGDPTIRQHLVYWYRAQILKKVTHSAHMTRNHRLLSV